MKALLVAALGYALFVTYVYFTQSQLLFLPHIPGPSLRHIPTDVGLAFEELSLETADGEKLNGWYVPADQARGTLLFFHGNAGNISHRLDSIAIFHRLGLNVLIFDYRGYGLSSGKPSEAGTYRDAEAAWHHLVEERGIAPASIVLFGRSLGGAVATWLAMRAQPAGLIIESSFTSVPDLGSELYPWLPVRWLSRLQYNTRERLGTVRAPVLVIHSTQDEIIPFRHGRSLYEAANEPRHLLEMVGGHNDGFMVSGEAYRRGIDVFLDEILAPSSSGAHRER